MTTSMTMELLKNNSTKKARILDSGLFILRNNSNKLAYIVEKLGFSIKRFLKPKKRFEDMCNLSMCRNKMPEIVQQAQKRKLEKHG